MKCRAGGLGNEIKRHLYKELEKGARRFAAHVGEEAGQHMLPSRQRGYIATKAVCRLLRVVNIEDAGGCEVCSSVAIQILGCQLDMGAILALSRVRG